MVSVKKEKTHSNNRPTYKIVIILFNSGSRKIIRRRECVQNKNT